jgi:hypothetical protein
MHLAFAIEGYMPSSFRKIENICNTPDRQRLRRFADEHSYLIPTLIKVKGKYVLGYSVPIWMRDFFFDPNRSRHLYSTSLVIDECQQAIETHILDPNFDPDKNHGLVDFFTQALTLSSDISISNIANATHLLESATNGSDQQELLLFLEYLSEIRWFDIYHKGWGQRLLANRIARWVCTTLVVG